MRHPRLMRLRLFVQNPLTQLASGLILMGTGMAEVVEDLASTARTWRVGAHHGVIIFGLLQVLQNIPPVVDGLERWFRATETDDSEPTPAKKESPG